MNREKASFGAGGGKRKRQDRAFAMEQKENDCTATIRVAEIEAEQKLRVATLEATEKQKARTRDCVDTLRLGIENLTTQKRQLTVEML